MQAQTYNSSTRHARSNDASLTSSDNSNANIDTSALAQILNTLRTSPVSLVTAFSSPKSKTERRLTPRCLTSTNAGQETFDTSFGGKATVDDTPLRIAYDKLLKKHKKVCAEAEELKRLNRGLVQDKLHLSASLRNSQQQLSVLLRSVDIADAKQREIEKFTLSQEKAQAEQRLTFCYKKLESYIVKAEHADTLIEDLRFQLARAERKCESRAREVLLRFAQKHKVGARLNVTAGHIGHAVDTSLIAEMQHFSGKCTEPAKGGYCRQLSVECGSVADSFSIEHRVVSKRSCDKLDVNGVGMSTTLMH